jgi:hypothetical protein
MAPLYGRLRGNHWRKEVTRLGTYDVESKLETWEGSVRTVLERDGTFRVYVGSKYDPRTLVARATSTGWRRGARRNADGAE